MSIPFLETQVNPSSVAPPPPCVRSEGPRETPEEADLTTTNRGETGRRTRSMEVLLKILETKAKGPASNPTTTIRPQSKSIPYYSIKNNQHKSLEQEEVKTK